MSSKSLFRSGTGRGCSHGRAPPRGCMRDTCAIAGPPTCLELLAAVALARVHRCAILSGHGEVRRAASCKMDLLSAKRNYSARERRWAAFNASSRKPGSSRLLKAWMSGAPDASRRQDTWHRASFCTQGTESDLPRHPAQAGPATRSNPGRTVQLKRWHMIGTAY
eukprot:365377-Chlamydomonas_euryale.AAC.28